MATDSVNRLFHRFWAIILTLIVANYGVLQKNAVAELVVSQFQSCFVEADDGNHGNSTITLHGSLSKPCKLQVSTSSASATQIQIMARSPHNYFFYVKRLGASRPEHCPHDVAVLDKGKMSCETVLFYENLELNLRGDVRILLREVSVELSADDECFVTDTVYYHSKVNPTLPQCSVQWYHDAIVCDRPGSSRCIFDFPPNCNVTLGYREASFSCSDDGVVKRRVVVVYPDPMSMLDAAASNIVAIQANAFQLMNATQTLLLQHNQLRTLNCGMFNDLHSLLALKLRGNLLITIAPGCFRVLKMLSLLDLSDNMLNLLPGDLFRTLVNLDELYLNNNQIDFLNVTSFHGLHNLKKLNLEYNLLTTLDVGLFQDLNSLEKLDLDSNRFFTLNVGLFQGLSSLRILDIDFNILSVLKPGVFQGLGSLRELDIDNNQMETIDAGLFQGLVSLVELDLDVNKLSTLDVGCFQELNNLKEFELDSNQLDILDIRLLHGLWKLTILGLAINELATIDVNMFQGFVSLRELYIHDNYIVTFEVGTFEGLKELTELALSHNRLVAIGVDLFKGLISLISLRLDGNQLSALPSGVFQGMYNLESLYLDDNHLRSLENDIFKDLISLDKLTLQVNQLKLVDFNLLHNTGNLAILDLSDNRLQKIPNITHLRDLILVILNRNELRQIQSDTFSDMEYSVHLVVSQHEICECYVPLNITCSASLVRSPYLTCDRLLSDRVLVTMMWVISVSAICGNMFVLCWRNKHSSKNKVQSYLMSNLAMSDLLMGVYMITIAIADIHYGEGFPMAAEAWRTGVTCKIAGALAIISSEASVFFVTLISIDRFINIKYPFNSTFKFGSKSTMIAIVFVWTIASAIGIVPSILAGKNSDFYDNSHVCVGLPLALVESFTSNTTTQELASTKYKAHTIEISRSMSQGYKPGMYFSTAVFLGVNCICYIAIFLCYVVIIQEVRKSSKQAGIAPEMKDQLKMTAKVTAIVATDFLCWSPIIFLGILVQLQVTTLPPSVFAWSVTFVLPINSAINPYLYTIADIVSSRKDLKEKSINSSSHHSMHQQTYREAEVKRPVKALSSIVQEKDAHVPEQSRRPESNV